MACSYCRHSLVRIGSVSTTGDQTKLSCLVCVAVWTQLQTRQDSFVLSWPGFDEFCLVSIQFPNDVTLHRQVIGLIKWPNFGDWLKNICFLRCLNYTGFCYLLTDFFQSHRQSVVSL